MPETVDHQQVRRSPAEEWQPKPGDLRCDREGDLWFIYRKDESGKIGLKCSVNSFETVTTEEVWNFEGPLTLVHRETAR